MVAWTSLMLGRSVASRMRLARSVRGAISSRSRKRLFRAWRLSLPVRWLLLAAKEPRTGRARGASMPISSTSRSSQNLQEQVVDHLIGPPDFVQKDDIGFDDGAGMAAQ